MAGSTPPRWRFSQSFGGEGGIECNECRLTACTAHTLQLSRRFLNLPRNLVDDVHHMDRLLTPTRHMISHLWLHAWRKWKRRTSLVNCGQPVSPAAMQRCTACAW